MNSSTTGNDSNKKNNYNNIVEIIIMLIIAIIVLGSFVTIYGLYLGSNAPVAVTTGSMEPVYGGYQKTGYDNYHDNFYNLPLEGDMLVLIERVPKLGDTIVYQEGTNTPIVHRVIAIREDSSGKIFYLTKGDFNDRTDHSNHSWIAEEEVLGVVLLRFPMIGWLSLNISRETMRLFLLVCLGIVLLLMLFEEEEDSDEKTGKKVNKKLFGIVGSFLRKFKPNFKEKRILVKKLFSTPSGNLTIFFIIISLVAFGLNVSAFNQGSNSIEPINFNINYENINFPQNNSQNLHVFIYDLKISSHGIFNWINKVELRLNSTESEIAYVWDIPYSFNGDFKIKGAVPISYELLNGSGDYFFDLYFTIYSNGFFAQLVKTQNFQHIYSV